MADAAGAAPRKKKRHRRTAKEIERRFPCRFPGCTKAYGCEGSLNHHMRRKHPPAIGFGGVMGPASPVVAPVDPDLLPPPPLSLSGDGRLEGLSAGRLEEERAELFAAAQPRSLLEHQQQLFLTQQRWSQGWGAAAAPRGGLTGAGQPGLLAASASASAEDPSFDPAAEFLAPAAPGPASPVSRAPAPAQMDARMEGFEGGMPRSDSLTEAPPAALGPGWGSTGSIGAAPGVPGVPGGWGGVPPGGWDGDDGMDGITF